MLENQPNVPKWIEILLNYEDTQEKGNELRTLFQENPSLTDFSVTKQKLQKLFQFTHNGSAQHRVDVIARGIIEINNIDQRIEKGDQTIVQDICRVFANCYGRTDYITHSQLSNVLQLCALHQPDKFAEFDNIVNLFLKHNDNVLPKHLNLQIVGDVVQTINDLYFSIRKLCVDETNLSNLDIKNHLYDIALSVAIILTDPCNVNNLSALTIDVTNIAVQLGADYARLRGGSIPNWLIFLIQRLINILKPEIQHCLRQHTDNWHQQLITKRAKLRQQYNINPNNNLQL